MKQTDFLKEFKELLDRQADIVERKNHDYSGSDNAFGNFEMISTFTRGGVTVEEGILVRMIDKLQRASNLLRVEGKVKDEKLEDTLTDLAVYANILNIYAIHRSRDTA